MAVPTRASTLPIWWGSTLLAAAGYVEEFFASNPGLPWHSQFHHYAARQARYDVFWAHYEGNVYRRIQQFQPELKEAHNLYGSTRSVESPAYRLGEFWAEHLLAGCLDDDAGDGLDKPSAIPIETGSPKAAELRTAIGTLWRDSNWQSNKDTWTRFGAVLGDVGLMVFDDPDRQKVSLRVIHPRIVREVTLDAQGNCKGYMLEEMRDDPRYDRILELPPLVRYTEVAYKSGDQVVFETYLEGEPWDWRDYPDDRAPRVGPTWTEDYGFIPFVWHQHRDLGVGAGWSEMQPSLSKLMELDDLASKVDDQIRKTVDAVWILGGVSEADLTIEQTGGDDYDDDGRRISREPGRTDLPIITTATTDIKAIPLVAPLDLAAAAARIDRILQSIEKNHEELQLDSDAVAGTASGKARRIARERVEARVSARRAGYDNALVRAQMMAVSIGAARGYPGYEGFDAESYEAGDLAHAIGDRPVFAVDEMDHIEEMTARSTVVSTLCSAEVPLEIAMEVAGFAPDLIARMKRAKAAAAKQALDQVNARMKAAAAAGYDTGNGDGTDGQDNQGGGQGGNLNGPPAGGAVGDNQGPGA